MHSIYQIYVDVFLPFIFLLLLSLVFRISCGYGYYAISFGVQQLSGNLYINLILINAMDIIAIVVWYFTNW